MIIPTILESGLIERVSNRGVKIRNIQTNVLYDKAVDLANEERIRRGFAAYTYEETDIAVEQNEAPEVVIE